MHIFFTVMTFRTPSILSFTSQEFGSFVYQHLQKGTQHAILAYQEWFRSGKIEGRHRAFANAQHLLQTILKLADFSLLPLVGERQDQTAGKFLLKTADQLEIESVLIPMQAGGTLCLSSQVGCRMGCTFCETGRMGLLRNLNPEEMTCQLFVARFILGLPVRNLVFMGMGEPFDNYDHVMRAFKIFTDPHGFGLGAHHLTISTSGRVPEIYRLMEEKGPIPHLAVSLNAPVDALRTRLMPINRAYPLKELYRAIQDFNKKRGKSVLIAYVLIEGQNDTLSHAEELANFLSGLHVKINIIPYNPQSCTRFCAPQQQDIEAFTTHLRAKGYYTLLRQTKGQSIMAACGQLGNLALRRRRVVA